MGLDPARIPMYMRGAAEQTKFIPGFDIGDIEVTCNPSAWNDLLLRDEPIFQFATAPGWRGAIEYHGGTHSALAYSAPHTTATGEEISRGKPRA
jgi:hypothetical protein